MSKMHTFRLNKLVRDGIVANHEREGGSCVSKTLTGKELKVALQDKLREEIEELLNQTESDPSEYSDVLAVLEALAALDRITIEDITARKREREDEIGGFRDGTYIQTVTVPETSWLYRYYASKPDRFPEITGD